MIYRNSTVLPTHWEVLYGLFHPVHLIACVVWLIVQLRNYQKILSQTPA